MIDVSAAFGGAFVGFSAWETHDGRVQVSLKRRNGGAFAIGTADSFEKAWAEAWTNSGTKPKKRRREIDDLA